MKKSSATLFEEAAGKVAAGTASYPHPRVQAAVGKQDIISARHALEQAAFDLSARNIQKVRIRPEEAQAIVAFQTLGLCL